MGSDRTPRSRRIGSHCRLLVEASILAALLCASAVVFGQPAEAEVKAKPAGSILIPAWAFDRGNARTFTSQWADAEPMVANGGTIPNLVEYDIEFPVPATYAINICYAAQQARPVECFLDDSRLGLACRSATGTWNTSEAKWED